MLKQNIENKIVEWVGEDIHHWYTCDECGDIKYEKALADFRSKAPLLAQSIVDEIQNLIKSPELMEYFANIEHERWAKWQKHMHSKILPTEHDALMQIGTEFIERWNRQINTPYLELSEEDKEKDREQVKPYIDKLLTSLQVKEDK